MTITVLKPGMLTSLQDRGRYGHQHLGLSVSGAMDTLSQSLANLVLGNDENAATLEITLLGPVLRFNEETVIALCGADLSAEIDGIPVNQAEPTRVKAGEQLTFGRRVRGVRCYLAVRGGLDAPMFMGSASTYLRGRVGGLEGRALKAGDTLRALAHAIDLPALPFESAALDGLLAEQVGDTVRVMPGREWDHFDTAARDMLLGQPYKITTQSDRMGYRLEGPVLERANKRDILSEAITFGAMQVPPNGQPIVLMAERQTTGGYPKIAQVIGADLGKLAQCAPGDTVRFELTDLGTAHRALRARAAALQQVREAAWQRYTV
ncbi:biotin-dependent carboxyltransferase family protein [Robbsia sp. KACC 23696]|uniref:5-oxoprolinase subunit C family protein n=1 Tax=Robbsia sp. KACC 23696 TaxID=3149231 RepID=UPI00325A8E33